ncbi:hypothetical protein GUJ93_ZPchr0008g11885 [Zizania palustris]|uniref:Uncharacterized protein n=1 Tax=Zizania palustris TaxID=103762 RepID=A0A8J5RXR1_ZIZPA|nr:hypothetical protein GUJ93_ZPchr0008g11885 [Zizania palustris]
MHPNPIPALLPSSPVPTSPPSLPAVSTPPRCAPSIPVTRARAPRRRRLPIAGPPPRHLPAAPPPSPPPALLVNRVRAPRRRPATSPQPPRPRRCLRVGALSPALSASLPPPRSLPAGDGASPLAPSPCPCAPSSVRLPATSPPPPPPPVIFFALLFVEQLMMVTGSDEDNVAGACAANAGQSNKDKGKGTMTAGRSTMTDTNVEDVCKNDNPIMDWFCNFRNESASILDEFIESDLETANPSTFIAQELEMDETEVAAFKKDTLQKRGKKRRLGFVEEDVEVEDVESDSVQGSQEYAEFDSNDSEGDGKF